jgi:hypothetical protein
MDGMDGTGRKKHNTKKRKEGRTQFCLLLFHPNKELHDDDDD